MKISTKTSKLYLLVTLIILFVSCHKGSTPAPANYDISNRIFRVHATSSHGGGYQITINKDAKGSADTIVANENSGADFNYGFTPVIGNSITVQVQSSELIYCVIFYKGVQLLMVGMTVNSEGQYYGEYVYNVTN
jgi:hypothetical protein